MNKLCKVIASISLASVFTTSLVSCQNNNNVKDTDFDGLTDNIDPAPNDNKYQISLVNKTEDGEEETGKLTLTMDYRDFLSTGYKYNLGILGSFLVNPVNSSYQPKVHNNVYPKVATEESKVFPLLAQIGAKDIQMIKAPSFDEDPYDVVDAIMAHHTFINENVKYQVFFIVISPYPNRAGWVSNFDVGAIKDDESKAFTDSYVALEGENHNDWLNANRLDHKGFSVTATRLVKAINDYQVKYKEKDTKAITYITGHSRGGSVAGLVGKDFVDKEQDIRAYCFNPANTTTVDETISKKEAYVASIFNVINNGDLVSRIPSFGFKLYGKDIRNDIDNKIYNDFMKKDYEGNSSESVAEVAELFNKIVTKDEKVSRNNFYELREEDPYYPERWEGTQEEMNNLKEELDNGYFMPNDSYAKKCFTYGDVTKDNDDEETYYIEYQTRPALLKSLLVDLLVKNDLTYILSYLKLLDRLITDALALYLLSDFSALGVKNGHEQPIACVMAAQYKENRVTV